ncbi:MAG TPA: hypothetical protein VHU22_15615 [Xanthobacteraceae bacterium]|nr:hypothetical protein [Xanthobacteraceae bacterium]
MKKRSIALALCGVLVCSPAYAKTKTFVGVLWPMFGPFLAVGLVELVAELKLMPDVEVRTYLHQHWPSLVDDLNHLPKGTHTLVVGYSLGANSTVFVANKVDYIDSIIALQPSMLSWNPELTGKVGRIVEIYNPRPEMTLGGMGSKKLVGDKIEYIANNDTHMGTQFSADFRDLVKGEIARLSAEDDGNGTAQAELPQQAAPSSLTPAPDPNKRATDSQNDAKATGSDTSKSQSHCDIANSGHPGQAQKPDELTEKIIEAQRAEPRHYGSIVWQAASTAEKKPDALTQKIIDTASCSD